MSSFEQFIYKTYLTLPTSLPIYFFSDTQGAPAISQEGDIPQEGEIEEGEISDDVSEAEVGEGSEVDVGEDSGDESEDGSADEIESPMSPDPDEFAHMDSPMSPDP